VPEDSVQKRSRYVFKGRCWLPKGQCPNDCRTRSNNRNRDKHDIIASGGDSKTSTRKFPQHLHMINLSSTQATPCQYHLDGERAVVVSSTNASVVAFLANTHPSNCEHNLRDSIWDVRQPLATNFQNVKDDRSVANDVEYGGCLSNLRQGCSDLSYHNDFTHGRTCRRHLGTCPITLRSDFGRDLPVAIILTHLSGPRQA
jgi:hypothetical protein